MINSIINIFKEQAREHKLIKAFCYNRDYELGNGKDTYPLFWLEDPVRGYNKENTFSNSVDFSILFLPCGEESVSHLQNLAFSTGLNIIERIKKQKHTLGLSISSGWDYMTVRNYYDDNAAGCRFSVTFTQMNMQNLCLIDEQFDPDKAFADSGSMPDFNIAPANNREIFTDKFPDFDLKIG
ncbi:MAG: hypothetical protein LBN74_00645 [Prevotella sp.]|jgi:hypothetical protein|nr:hypothetical protein [Prevotella sp.]